MLFGIQLQQTETTLAMNAFCKESIRQKNSIITP